MENHIQTVVVNDQRFAVEERNGNMSFNLTQMAKAFGKTPRDWRKTAPAQEYLEELSKRNIIPLADLLEVRKGGTPEMAGTWANDYRIAVRFAQWLDPKFSVAVDELIYKVLTKQAVVLEPKRGVMPIYYQGKKLYHYRTAIAALGGSKQSTPRRRKLRYPEHFIKVFGKFFITEYYFDLIAGYYDYKNGVTSMSNQLTLSL